MTADHRAKLRRLRILQTLEPVAPSPMGELALLARLRADPELAPDVPLLRVDLRYLQQQKLVELVEVDGVDWLASWITPAGRDWLALPGEHGLEIYSPDYLPQAKPDNRHGRVSSIDLLDPEGKAWLDQQLVSRNFSGYSELARMLLEKGYYISRSAVHRYGQRYQAELQELRRTVEMAKGFAEVVGDDAGALAQTLTGLLQQEAITILRDKKYEAEGIELPKLVSAVAQLNRSDVSLKRYAGEVRARARAAARKAAAIGQQGGLTADRVSELRKLITGIAA